MSSASTTTNHSHLLWRSRLSSALRTALACTIVGATTLYSPQIIRCHLKFPAFSYMTAVLIVGEATLGDAVKGAACALYGTALGLIPAILTLHMMQFKNNITATTISVAVAISSFAVAIFDSTALITKRIALGQIVIVYVTAFKEAGQATPVLNPVPVAASTAVGAVSSVLALVLPYPRLAYCQVSKKRELYTEIALERLRLFVNGICADSGTCMKAWASQAKSLTVICAKLLQSIKLNQESMKWERIFLSKEPGDTLEQIEIPLKGMEMALVSTASSPLKVLNQQLKADLISQRNQICIKLRQHISMIKSDIQLDKTLESLHVTVPQNLQDLPCLFFLFCARLFLKVAQSIPPLNSLQDDKVLPTTDEIADSCKEEEPSTKRTNYFNGTIWPTKVISIERFVIALKCSLSLSLAVLFGVLFSSDNGYWAGLTVAIAYTPFGDTTFRSASVRAHGTALGSVYGLLGSFISQNLMEVRLLVLLPWIVFTSFLHRSRMYGQVGGLAATISAMIILGRKNYGSPMIFAVQRLTETYVGLCCAILFELLLQPKRASTLARAQVAESLAMLGKCLDSVACSVEMKDKERELRKIVDELKKFIREAELEPNFWFLPFPVACYNKIHGSLVKMMDLLVFMVHGMELLARESHEMNETVKGDLDNFGNLIVSMLKCFEDVIQIKSLARFEKEYLEKEASRTDIEIGKGLRQCGHESSSFDEDECEKIAEFFIRRANESVSRESKGQVVLCLATLGFCCAGLMREVTEMKKGILELVQWENPSCHINLHEISCKLEELSA